MGQKRVNPHVPNIGLIPSGRYNVPTIQTKTRRRQAFLTAARAFHLLHISTEVVKEFE
jgi:hypothetical protein